MTGVALATAWEAAAAVAAPRRAAERESCAVDPSTEWVRVASQGATYDVLVHVPDGAVAGMPLVFNLHGSTQSGAAHRGEGEFDAAADAFGYVVAYPDGGVPGGPRPPAPVAMPAGYHWNIPGVPMTGDVPVPPGARDDVAFIGDAVDAMVETLCVDPSRVYVTGASGGGRMASLLGCALSDKVAAIAPVIGVRAGNPDPGDDTRPDPATCRPERPVPVAALHGLRDNTNPYDGGGPKYWRYSVPTAMARWAALNGCSRLLADRPLTATVTERRYAGCRSGADVVLYVSSVMGHTWPGSRSTTATALAPLLGDSDASFRGNEIILSFFDEHRLRP